MSTQQRANLPVALSRASRQFDRWRSRQGKRTRLPEELWQKAVALAGEHGLNKTASALGLKYYSLKKRIDATAVEEPGPEDTRCEFLELLPGPTTTSSIECTIELEDASGVKVRMHVQGVRVPDLVSFARLFRGGRA